MKSRFTTLREDERIPFRVHPMLATLVTKAFHRAGWVSEEKYDGYRILAYKEGAKVTLLSRNAKDLSRSFPEIARAIGELKPRTLLLDGEAVAVDRNHVTRFQLLQRGGVPIVYAAFDCHYQDGHDLRNAPLRERRLGHPIKIGLAEILAVVLSHGENLRRRQDLGVLIAWMSLHRCSLSPLMTSFP